MWLGPGQPVALPEGEELTYIRAVAYLPDGNSTEDLVFVNAPEYLEELRTTTMRKKYPRPLMSLQPP